MIPEPSPVTVPSLPPYQTDANSFRVYCVYKSSIPDYSLDTDFHLNKVADDPNFMTTSSISPPTIPGPFHDIPNPDNPYENKTMQRLMTWYYNGSNTKSLHDLNILAQCDTR